VSVRLTRIILRVEGVGVASVVALARDRDCVTFFFAGRERTSSGNSFLYKKHKCTNTYIRRESIYVRVRKQEKTNVMLRNAANYDSFDTHTYVHG